MKTAPPMRSGLLKINHVYAQKNPSGAADDQWLAPERFSLFWL